jgi:hypothetical protein
VNVESAPVHNAIFHRKTGVLALKRSFQCCLYDSACVVQPQVSENTKGLKCRTSSMRVCKFGQDRKNQPVAPTSSHSYLQLVLANPRSPHAIFGAATLSRIRWFARTHGMPTHLPGRHLHWFTTNDWVIGSDGGLFSIHPVQMTRHSESPPRAGKAKPESRGSSWIPRRFSVAKSLRASKSPRGPLLREYSPSHPLAIPRPSEHHNHAASFTSSHGRPTGARSIGGK